MGKDKVAICWMRRDLRLEDHHALYQVSMGRLPVIVLFIVDEEILTPLDRKDARVTFIHDCITSLNNKLRSFESSVLVKRGNVLEVWKNLLREFDIQEVAFNRDYEPLTEERDKKVTKLLRSEGVTVRDYKDQVIFEADEVLKANGDPYTIFTPYKNVWFKQFYQENTSPFETPSKKSYFKAAWPLPTLKDIGFERSDINVPDMQLAKTKDYEHYRDFPAMGWTSMISTHLRFGTVGIRRLLQSAPHNEKWLSEVAWREFFKQILKHFPRVVDQNFKAQYDKINWRNNAREFESWKAGKTGYPMVDAGMRQLNQTGYMHNRVRMITASFLCKHLLIDWKWGERYFAEKLLDYDLSSNNGNWQWCAGTGCDAAPYFRVFNPTTQKEKFDKEEKYIRKWIPEYGTGAYQKPMVDHSSARERALKAYKEGLAV